MLEHFPGHNPKYSQIKIYTNRHYPKSTVKLL